MALVPSGVQDPSLGVTEGWEGLGTIRTLPLFVTGVWVGLLAPHTGPNNYVNPLRRPRCKSDWADPPVVMVQFSIIDVAFRTASIGVFQHGWAGCQVYHLNRNSLTQCLRLNTVAREWSL